MKSYDVAIIGGGVVGTALARELSRYRLRVALFEKEAELAFGVSKSNSGIIHPGTSNPPDSLKARLCVEGNRLTRKLAKELGIDVKEVGELVVVFNKEELAQSVAAVDLDPFFVRSGKETLFEESTQALVRDLEGLLLGRPFEVLASRGAIAVLPKSGGR